MVEEEVPRLDVAVDEPVVVHSCDPLTGFTRPANRLFGGHTYGRRDAVRNGPASHDVGYDVPASRHHVGVQDGEDVLAAQTPE
jgi:hypothetical protein